MGILAEKRTVLHGKKRIRLRCCGRMQTSKEI
jgi:hypothetical protein